MLMRTDPFRDLDRLTQQVFGTVTRPTAMAMDAYRQGHEFYVKFDLPGIDPASIDLTVEQNVLTIRAERPPAPGNDVEVIVNERPTGVFTRQVFLGETLDAEHIAADYNVGVLTLTIPVREAAKPRSIQVTSSDRQQASPPRVPGQRCRGAPLQRRGAPRLVRGTGRTRFPADRIMPGPMRSRGSQPHPFGKTKTFFPNGPG